MLLFIVIRIYPIIETIRLSFYRYHITSPRRPFVGLRNYERLLEDDAFIAGLINTIQFSTIAVVATLVLAFAISLLLRSIERVSPIYELVFYIPVVIPWVPVSVIWKWIYDPTYGILNYFLSFFGVGKLNWLQDPEIIIYAIVIVSVWKLLGYFVIIYSVGLKSVPDELLEAVEIDGAGPIGRLRYIIIPLMKPIILFSIVMCTIIYFNVFAPVYVLTSSAQGAPAYELKVMVSEIYRNGFQFYRMGYAGSQSVVLLIFVTSLVFVQFLAFKERK